MSNDTTVPFLNPAFRDEMTHLNRAHAHTAIGQTVLAKIEDFPGLPVDTNSQGRRNVVRWQSRSRLDQSSSRVGTKLAINTALLPDSRLRAMISTGAGRLSPLAW